MLKLVADCDHCGRSTDRVLKLSRNNEGYKINIYEAGRVASLIYDDGWLLTRVAGADSTYCPACIRAYRLAAKS